MLRQRVVEAAVVDVAREVVQPLGEGPPAEFVEVSRFRDRLAHGFAELLAAHGSTRHAQHFETRVGAAHAVQIEQRRDELAPGQVAGSAEDHQHAGIALGQRREGWLLARSRLDHGAHGLPPDLGLAWCTRLSQSVWTKPSWGRSARW